MLFRSDDLCYAGASQGTLYSYCRRRCSADSIRFIISVLTIIFIYFCIYNMHNTDQVSTLLEKIKPGQINHLTGLYLFMSTAVLYSICLLYIYIIIFNHCFWICIEQFYHIVFTILTFYVLGTLPEKRCLIF